MGRRTVRVIYRDDGTKTRIITRDGKKESEETVGSDKKFTQPSTPSKSEPSPVPETPSAPYLGAVTRAVEGGGTITVTGSGKVTQRSESGSLIEQYFTPSKSSSDFVKEQQNIISQAVSASPTVTITTKTPYVKDPFVHKAIHQRELQKQMAGMIEPVQFSEKAFPKALQYDKEILQPIRDSIQQERIASHEAYVQRGISGIPQSFDYQKEYEKILSQPELQKPLDIPLSKLETIKKTPVLGSVVTLGSNLFSGIQKLYETATLYTEQKKGYEYGTFKTGFRKSTAEKELANIGKEYENYLSQFPKFTSTTTGKEEYLIGPIYDKQGNIVKTQEQALKEAEKLLAKYEFKKEVAEGYQSKKTIAQTYVTYPLAEDIGGTTTTQLVSPLFSPIIDKVLKKFPGYEGSKVQKVAEFTPLTIDRLSYAAEKTFETITKPLEYGRQSVSKAMSIPASPMFQETYTEYGQTKFDFLNSQSPKEVSKATGQFFGGVVRGALTGLKEEPEKVAGIAALTYVASPVITSLKIGGQALFLKTLGSSSTISSPAWRAVGMTSLKIAGAAKYAIPVAYGGVKYLEYKEADLKTPMAKGEFFGRMLSTEILPAHLGSIFGQIMTPAYLKEKLIWQGAKIQAWKLGSLKQYKAVTYLQDTITKVRKSYYKPGERIKLDLKVLKNRKIDINVLESSSKMTASEKKAIKDFINKAFIKGSFSEESLNRMVLGRTIDPGSAYKVAGKKGFESVLSKGMKQPKDIDMVARLFESKLGLKIKFSKISGGKVNLDVQSKIANWLHPAKSLTEGSYKVSIMGLEGGYIRTPKMYENILRSVEGMFKLGQVGGEVVGGAADRGFWDKVLGIGKPGTAQSFYRFPKDPIKLIQELEVTRLIGVLSKPQKASAVKAINFLTGSYATQVDTGKVPKRYLNEFFFGSGNILGIEAKASPFYGLPYKFPEPYIATSKAAVSISQITGMAGASTSVSISNFIPSFLVTIPSSTLKVYKNMGLDNFKVASIGGPRVTQSFTTSVALQKSDINSLLNVKSLETSYKPFKFDVKPVVTKKGARRGVNDLWVNNAFGDASYPNIFVAMKPSVSLRVTYPSSFSKFFSTSYAKSISSVSLPSISSSEIPSVSDFFSGGYKSYKGYYSPPSISPFSSLFSGYGRYPSTPFKSIPAFGGGGLGKEFALGYIPKRSTKYKPSISAAGLLGGKPITSKKIPKWLTGMELRPIV